MNSTPWLRLYTEILTDPKVMQLGGSLFKTWVLCLCLAKQHDGYLPDLSEIGFALRLRTDVVKQHVEALVSSGLIDRTETGLRPHNWDKWQYKSDDVNARVRDWRKRKRNVACNVTRNVAVTDQNTDTDNRYTPTPKTKNGWSPNWRHLEAVYPGEVNPDLDCQLFISVAETPEIESRIFAGLDRWKVSEKWERGYIPKLTTFLRDHVWDVVPAEMKAQSTPRPRVMM